MMNNKETICKKIAAKYEVLSTALSNISTLDNSNMATIKLSVSNEGGELSLDVDILKSPSLYSGLISAIKADQEEKITAIKADISQLKSELDNA